MNLKQFVAELAEQGVKLWVEGDRLGVGAAKGVLTPEVRDLLALYKAELVKLLQKKSNAGDTSIPQIPVSLRRNLPLSFAQEGIWFLSQLEPTNPFYNELEALRLHGSLNVVALEKSINKIIQRHSALRTNFTTVDGQPVQVIAESLTLSVQVLDLGELSESEREIALAQFATAQVQQPFDLTSSGLIEASVLKLTQTEHILLLTIHHIVWDAPSEGVLVKELAALYTAYCNDLLPERPELPIQYADFAVWQRQRLQGDVLESQLAYWKQQLSGAPFVLELPTDRVRPLTQTFRGACHRQALSKEITEALMSLSQRKGVTLFMTLLAALFTLLYRYTGQSDICVGTPYAGRDHPEIESLIGLFVNTLVLRTDLSGNPSFEELLSRVQDVALGAYAHPDLPFEKLVEQLQPERNLSYTPLCQVMFVLYPPMPQIDMEGLTVSRVSVETATAKFDLSLAFFNTDKGLIGNWEYNTDLFDAATIARMAGHFQTLLEGIVANPEQKVSSLPLLTEPERYQLLWEWNNTTKEYPNDKCIHQLFEEQVERSPDAIAVVFEEEQLTYRELNQRANKIAHHLRTLGVEPEVLVGICVERSLEMIVGLLGVLKAGGAYVPLDPAYPSERLALMLEDSAVPVLLTQQRLVDKLPQHDASVVCLDTQWEIIAQHSSQNLAGGVNAENLAYVIYTSGSTGKPKGVTIQHRSLVNYTTAVSIEYEIEKRDRVVSKERLRSMVEEHSADRVLQFASISFDASAEEIYTCLISGATLVLRTDSMLDSVGVFLQKCRDWEITVLVLPTAYWHELTAFLSQQANALPPSIRLVIIGGEKALPERWKTWIERVGQQVRLLNLYGPTEATVSATRYELSTANRATIQLPLGRPISNVQTYILDRNGQPVPIGVPGELHIGGAGLARGYLNRPDLTDKQFIPNPFSHQPSSRLYKTGDLARYLPDGNIEFLGRLDNQVKIRGFRIELGEIEAALASHPGVRETVVIVREDIPGDKRLVAYVVSIQAPPTIPALRQFLQQKLPNYMVPSAFVILSALPLTPNDKVDHRALPAPDTSLDPTSFVLPRDAVEQQLQRIWSEVLQHPTVGVGDNFFELGGHSLLTVRLMAIIQQQFGLNLPLATLFSSPTIEQLASRLRQLLDSQPSSPLVAIQKNGSKRPFFCVPGIGGNVIYLYELAHHLGSEQPFYGLQAKGLDGESEPFTQLSEIAAYYIEAIQTVQPRGPYLLGGHSFGGIVAFEMATQLQKQGHEVALVAIIDAVAPILGNKANCEDVDNAAVMSEFASLIGYMLGKDLSVSKETLASLTPEEQLNYLKEQLIQVNLLPPDAEITSVQGSVQVYKANLQAHHVYLPQQVLFLRIALFRAEEIDDFEDVALELTDMLKAPDLGWNEFSTTTIDVHVVPGNHINMMQKPYVQVLAAQLRTSLEQAQAHRE